MHHFCHLMRKGTSTLLVLSREASKTLSYLAPAVIIIRSLAYRNLRRPHNPLSIQSLQYHLLTPRPLIAIFIVRSSSRDRPPSFYTRSIRVVRPREVCSLLAQLESLVGRRRGVA